MEQEITASNEVMLYMAFWRQFILRRMTDFTKVWDKSSLKELPRSCVIHLIDDNFLMNKPIVFVPEDKNWLLNMLPSLKFINHVTQPVQGPIPFKEELFLPQKGVIPTLLNYRKRTMKWMRIWKDTTVMPPVLKSQAVISYLSLYRARIFGQLKATRRFNYIFTSVLNNICKLPNQMHFIPIPVGNVEYTRGEFIPSFREYTKATVRHPNDPWYQFCMHLYGFIHTGTPSLFSKLPSEILSKIHFILYTDRSMLIINLRSMLDFNQGKSDVVMLRFIKQLNSLAQQGQALSFTDFGTVEPNVDEETDIDTTGLTEDDINSDTLDTSIYIAKVEKNSSLSDRVNLSPIVDEEEVVRRPKDNVSDHKAEAYKFSKLSQMSTYSRISDKFKRFLTDNRVFDYIRYEHSLGTEVKSATRALLSVLDSDKLNKEEQAVIPDPNMHKAMPTSNVAMPAKPATVEIADEKPIEITHYNTLPNIGKSPKLHLVKADKIEDISLDAMPVLEEVDDKFTKIQPKLVNNGKTVTNAPAYTKAPSKEAQKAFDTSATNDLDIKAADVISQHEELTPSQTARAIKLSNAYKDIQVDGKRVEDIINSSPDDTVSKNELDFLKDQVPDPSMLKSSVCNFDTEYMDKFFKRDLIMELASFNRVGMFLKDVKITDISDSMNSMYEVNAKYEDYNHKQHTVRFTIPKVDKRGYCFINGGLKVLKKQRITNPICKVSPTRVTLSSDYNKYLVERCTTVAHSFINYIDKIVENSEKQIAVSFGTAKLPVQPYPYEFTAISKKYTSMTVSDAEDSKNPWFFFFNNAEKINDYFLSKGFTKEQIEDALDSENDVKGYLIGLHNVKNPVAIYMKLDGSISIIGTDSGVTKEGSTFIDLLCEICNLDISHLSEWTEFKLLSKSVPTIFALCYRYGLSHMLNYTKCKYAIYDRKSRYPRRQSDVIIKFKDKVLVIPRAPLSHSLLFAGLNNYDLSKRDIEEMDGKDIYFDLLQAKKMSVHNLKGIDNFFDLFVDPITRDVLFRMGEPTEAKDLLIRATTLLTTEDHPPVSANTNYRFRSYERICTAVYKILANTYSTYRYRGIGASNTFSIKDFEITNMVISDQLMEPVDQINPVNDIKYREEYGHGGAGGRQSTDTFMIEDRQWPEDGVGVIGESSVDNGKTGYAGNLSSNPTIDNIRGLTINKKLEDVEPSEAFTSTTLLGPCVTSDDSKRLSFLNIHLSHYVATKEMSLSRVRTGYERVAAHRCKPPFAYAAEFDGTIENIDEEAHIITVYYPQQKKRMSLEYGDLYRSNGGGGFFTDLRITINGFKTGDKVKKGDIIIYNEQFFHADPFNKQVDLNYGQLANVVIIDNSQTVEDSSIISSELAEKLEFYPVHPRDIVITKNTTIHKYAPVGTKVSNTDPLMIFDQSDLGDMFGGLDEEAQDLMAKINRQTPRAKFTGTVVQIDVFYIGDTENMSQSAKNLVNYVNRAKAKKALAAKDSDNKDEYPSGTKITQSTRIGTTVLDEDTLIVRFYIRQQQPQASGDKQEWDSSLKSVCAGTVEGGWDVEDGSVHCDGLFSAVGINKRIICSPIMTGILNRTLEKVENDVLDMYFK